MGKNKNSKVTINELIGAGLGMILVLIIWTALKYFLNLNSGFLGYVISYIIYYGYTRAQVEITKNTKMIVLVTSVITLILGNFIAITLTVIKGDLILTLKNYIFVLSKFNGLNSLVINIVISIILFYISMKSQYNQLENQK